MFLSTLFNLFIILISVSFIYSADDFIEESEKPKKLMSEADYDAIFDGRMQDNKLRVIYVYKVKPDHSIEQTFSTTVLNYLVTAKEQLQQLMVDVELYQIDCATNAVSQRCLANIDDSYHRFFALKNSRSWEEHLRSGDTEIDIGYMVTRLLQLISADWPNFAHTTATAGGKYLDDLFKRRKGEDIVICYGDKHNIIGRSFCYTVGKLLESKEKAPFVVALDKRNAVLEVSLFTEVDLGVDSLLPMFGLWYLNCSGRKEIKSLKDCDVYPYLADNGEENIETFFQCLKLPPVIELKGNGKLPKEYEKSMCSLGYYFYLAETKEESDVMKHRRKQAMDISKQVRGSMAVVLINVNGLKEDVKEKLISEEELSEVPLIKIQLGDALTGTRGEMEKVEGDAVAFFKQLMKAKYDLRELHDSLTTVDSGVTDTNARNDPRAQDDEVELVLHSLRDESCFFCPPNFGVIKELTDKTTPELIKNELTFSVLYWVNVDTLSRAAFSILLDAGSMLDKMSDTYKQVGSLACHNWPDVCAKYEVTTWPRLLTYKEGKLYKEYMGVWEADMVANYLNLVHQPALVAVSNEDYLKKFFTGSGFGGKVKIRAVTVIFLESWKDHEVTEAYGKASMRLHGTHVMGAFTGPEAVAWVKKNEPDEKLPLILTVRPGDMVQSRMKWKRCSKAKTSQDLVDSMVKFVLKSSKPTVMEWTESSAPMILKQKKPIVLLIGKDLMKGKLYEDLWKVAKNKQIRDDTVLTYLEKDRMKNSTHGILKAYGLKDVALPALTIVDLKKGKAYTLPSLATGSESVDMSEWILNVLNGNLAPSATLERRTWEDRPLMYDYKGYIYGESSVHPSVIDTRGEDKAEKEKIEEIIPPSVATKVEEGSWRVANEKVDVSGKVKPKVELEKKHLEL